MALGIYGTGQLYGAVANTEYGRIDPAIATAQSQAVRQTALKITVRDSFPNRWEHVAGTAIKIPDAWYVPGVTSAMQAYAGYQLQMGMCVLGNGNIIRVRIGDGTLNNRNIYRQTITDPTVASQWTTWSLEYSGTHYAVAVMPATSSTYYVYAAKADGVYKNNVLKQSITNVIKLVPVVNDSDNLFALVVKPHAKDKRRTIDIYRSYDIESVAFVVDDNYDWFRTDLSAYYEVSTSIVWRAQVSAFHSDPRSVSLAESLMFGKAHSLSAPYFNEAPNLVRGFGSQAGNNAILFPILRLFNDGYFYLFYSESRYDASGDKAISANTVFWQRAKFNAESPGLKFWTEPVAIGFDDMPNTGFEVIERSGYLYLANNGAVWRRPTTTTQDYEVSNYVPSVELSIPRSNQEGSGSFRIANPNGINDAVSGFTDREVKVEIGIKVADGTYKYGECNRWWIDEVNTEKKGSVNRISVTLYDLWRRLAVPLRDTYNFVGQVKWKDICAGGSNKLYNYYPRACTATVLYTTDTSYYCHLTKIVASSFFLYTGWKGHSAFVSVRSRGGKLDSGVRFGVVARYQDPSNYLWAFIKDGSVYFRRFVAGKEYSIGSGVSVGALTNPTISITLRLANYEVKVNGVTKISGSSLPIDFTKPGYCGVKVSGTTSKTFDNFELTTWEQPYTTSDLIRTALALGDFHDVVVAGGDEPQLAVVWGPQTDLATPAAALAALLNQYKLDLAWHNGVIHVGQFKEVAPVKTLENQIISSEDTEKAGRRINLAVVDGQEDTYIEIDGADTRERGRQISRYFDLPELTSMDAVRARAQEEVRKGVVGVASKGSIPYLWDLWRMDVVTWIDATGDSTTQRIEGLEVSVNQGLQPHQRMVLDLSPIT
jgi:hypothetical protein